MVYTTLRDLRSDVVAFEGTLEKFEEDFPTHSVAMESQNLFTQRMATIDQLAWGIFSKITYMENTLKSAIPADARSKQEDSLKELHELRTQFEKMMIPFATSYLSSMVVSS